MDYFGNKRDAKSNTLPVTGKSLPNLLLTHVAVIKDYVLSKNSEILCAYYL